MYVRGYTSKGLGFFNILLVYSTVLLLVDLIEAEDRLLYGRCTVVVHMISMLVI
jgi:hypothetical protein